MINYYKIHNQVKLFISLQNKAFYLLIPQFGLHQWCYEDFIIYLLVKYEKYSIFSGGSSTNHTGFSDPTFYYTFQYVMALAGHIGSGALKDILRVKILIIV